MDNSPMDKRRFPPYPCWLDSLLCMCMFPCRTIAAVKSIDRRLVGLFAVGFVCQSWFVLCRAKRFLGVVFLLLCTATQSIYQWLRILLNSMTERVLFSVQLPMSCQCQHSFQVCRRCCCSHPNRWLWIRLLSYCPNVQHNWMNDPKSPIDQWSNVKWHVHVMSDCFRWSHSIQSPTVDYHCVREKKKKIEIRKCVVQRWTPLYRAKTSIPSNKKGVRKKNHAWERARANILLLMEMKHNNVASAHSHRAAKTIEADGNKIEACEDDTYIVDRLISFHPVNRGGRWTNHIAFQFDCVPNVWTNLDGFHFNPFVDFDESRIARNCVIRFVNCATVYAACQQGK